MVYSKYILTTKDKKLGVNMSEKDLLKLIKLCEIRNMKMYNKLVEWYEYLEGVKFDKELIK